jgi:hypothetical protein
MLMRRLGRPLGAVVMFTLFLYLAQMCLPACAAASFPARARHSLANLKLDPAPDEPRIPVFGVGDNGDRGNGDGDETTGAGGSGRSVKIVGTSLLVSGVFLCSWGITSWEVEKYQCCPARNTGNVIKIVAGVVLINAGLMYLLGAAD